MSYEILKGLIKVALEPDSEVTIKIKGNSEDTEVTVKVGGRSETRTFTAEEVLDETLSLQDIIDELEESLS